jgi:hypothetical protein
MVALAQIAMDARLLVGAGGLGRQPERCLQLDQGRGRLADLVQGLGQGTQRHDLAVRAVDLAEQRECLPAVADSLLAFTLAQVDPAKL